ncbi:MAG: hypothetical protein LBU34_14425 [Planctomycetaceae bacterium]|nr:hypothetical protein [Planctomycetaceae bacterium]
MLVIWVAYRQAIARRAIAYLLLANFWRLCAKTRDAFARPRGADTPPHDTDILKIAAMY